MSDDIARDLAGTGSLRAGLNTQNFLLVSGRDEAGNPIGVAPSMAQALQAAERLPASRILEGRFTTGQQAIGTRRANNASAEILTAFVDDAKRSGLVADFIAQHRIQGLSVPSLDE